MKKLFFIIAIIALSNLFASAQAVDSRMQVKKYERLINYIENLYVDSVNIEELVDYSIVKMLQDMDPHSAFISHTELEKSHEALDGSFDGIGVQFRLIQDTIVVQDVISGGPSEKVGLRSGDRIVVVDGETVAGIKIDNAGVAKRLRGKKGTTVTVKVLRPGEKELITFDIIRDKIPIHSVDAIYVKGNTGYVKLNKFSRNTTEEMDSAFQIFQKAKVKNIILDLCDNTGGYMDQAINLCSRFITEENSTIVFTKGVKMPRYDYKTKTQGVSFPTGKLIVLINESSASASEITAGAIQDYDRGVIVGRRSFGKGLVQREMPLPDGSAVRLTIARYYTPSGRCIQKPYESYEEYSKDLLNRYEHGEYTNKDSITFADSLKYSTLKYGRTVYAGGGIMPDDFVPLDTTLRSKYHVALLRKNVLFSFVSEYVDANRSSLMKRYKNFDKFATEYTVPQEFLDKLKEKAIQKEINADSLPALTEKELNHLKGHLKSLLASDLYGSTYFWNVYNEMDPIVRRAFEIIEDEKLYNSLLKGDK